MAISWGARLMPGPPPNPNARRRRWSRPLVRLLPVGRDGEAPAWPLPGRSTKGELALWAELWRSPQAAAWEDLGWLRVVGRYARLVVLAERRSVTAALLGEVRQLEDRLGLNPMSLKRLGWEIGGPQAAADADVGAGEVARLDEYRARLDER